jgi:hypothetical protein
MLLWFGAYYVAIPLVDGHLEFLRKQCAMGEKSVETQTEMLKTLVSLQEFHQKVDNEHEVMTEILEKQTDALNRITLILETIDRGGG